MYGKEAIAKLFIELINCTSLDNYQYSSMLTSLNMHYTNFPSENILEDKIKILIDIDKIVMNRNNLTNIRRLYPNTVLPFLIKNIEEYIRIVPELIEKPIVDDETDEENSAFDENEILSLIYEKIKDKYKIKLLKYIKTSVSIKSNRNLSTKIKIYIIQNMFSTSDFAYFFSIYEKAAKGLKFAVYEKTVQCISYIITLKTPINSILFFELLEETKVADNIKKELFSCQISALSIDEAERCFDILKLDNYKKLFRNGRPQIIISETSQKILETIKSRWNISYNIDVKDPRYYRANGRKLIYNKE